MSAIQYQTESEKEETMSGINIDDSTPLDKAYEFVDTAVEWVRIDADTSSPHA